jgi:hypothetical protein
VLVAWSAHYGIPVQRELVIAWTCGPLAVAAIGWHPREVLRLFLDWLPIVLVLGAYDFTRGAADTFGIGVHAHPMVDFDRFLFFGETPTEWLQPASMTPTRSAGGTSPSRSSTPPTSSSPSRRRVPLGPRPPRLPALQQTSGLARPRLSATYIAFPAAPPWMAAEMGLLGEVHRTTADGWEVLGVGTAALFSEGQASVNLVVAVPSLHSGFCALVALFLWPRVRPRLRPLVAALPAGDGLALIAAGEHYFFDVLLGWLYAGSVMAAWSCASSRRRAQLFATGARPR